jgi:hypothetical protein
VRPQGSTSTEMWPATQPLPLHPPVSGLPRFDKERTLRLILPMGEFRYLPPPRMICRLTALISLIAIFSLPLHSHANFGKAQVTKECACVHGNRSEMAAPPAPVSPTPEFFEYSLASCELPVLSRDTLRCQSIRAPPAS